jgi:hypothetical protein
MIVKINGVPLEMYPRICDIDEVIVVKKGVNTNLKKIAVTLWTVSAAMLVKSKAYADGFYEEIQPLFYVFQEMALGIGALAIIAGLVLLVFKKRWGQITLKTTAFIVGGVFLVPSVLMLLAIIGTYLNDALYEALQNVREAKEIEKVMKGE